MDLDDSKIDDDLDKLLQHIKEDQQNSMDAPDSPKDPGEPSHRWVLGAYAIDATIGCTSSLRNCRPERSDFILYIYFLIFQSDLEKTSTIKDFEYYAKAQNKGNFNKR